MPIYAYIGSTDVSTYLKGLSVSPGGDGIVGDGTLNLDQQAGGLDLRAYQNVRVWQTFDSAGSGIASKGRLFGGLVATRNTGNVGTTKTWSLRCWDYNVILHRLVRDASPAKSIVIAAGTFAAQVQSLTTNIQQNGGGAVNTDIDNTGVASLYATMPAVTYPGGHSYGWYLQQLCNTAQSLNTALIPHFYIGVGATFGVGDTFGNPVLYVYDGASLPAIGLSFSDVVAGGRKGIYGTFRRTTDPTAMVQRRQAFFSDSHQLVTSSNSSSQSTYPFLYINHGGTGNTGYVMDEVIEDRDSTTFAQAQAALDQRNATESVPIDTFEFETKERVLPGDMVGLGYSTEGIADDTPYRVAKVNMIIQPPETIVSTLTLNSRRLGLFDDGTAVFAPPVEGDVVPPLPPSAFSLTANFYDGDTGDANMIFAIGASPSPDVVGYRIKGRVGHARVDQDVETELAPALIFPSGLAYDLQAFAYDRTNNSSEGYPAVSLTGTTAVPIYDKIPNVDFDAFDRLDSTLPYHWTRTVASGGTATYNTASNTGTACVKLSTTGTGGSTATITSSMTILRGVSNALIFYANASAAAPVTYTVTWYDKVQAFISSTTAATANLPTTYTRKVVAVTAPAGAAFYRISFTNSTLSKDIRVDTLSFVPQTPNDGLEVITDPSKIAPITDATNALYLYDTAGTARAKEYVTTTVFNLVAQNGPVSTNITSTTGDALFLAANGSDSSLTSTHGIQLSAASGSTITLSPSTTGVDVLVGATGTIIDGALHLTPITKTATFTADALAVVYLCNSASAITANLPTASGIAGRIYIFKNINTGKVTIDPNSSQTIDGITTYPLVEKYQEVAIMSDGSNWLIIGQAGLCLESDGTRWLGPEIHIDFSNYLGFNDFTGNMEALVCPIDSGLPFYADRYDIAWYNFGSNDVSNHWDVELRRLDSGIGFQSMATLSTYPGSGGTWTHTSTTSFSNNPTATSDIWIQINLTAVGSPGSLRLAGAKLRGRFVYS